MKHRGLAVHTGLGDSPEVLISGKNTGKVKDSLLNEIAKDCYETFNFEKKFGYCEAGFDGIEARFGAEPSYEFEELKLIIIAKNKNGSSYITGQAVGPWASRIRSKQKFYSDYQKKSKFVRFVDKWHGKLFL